MTKAQTAKKSEGRLDRIERLIEEAATERRLEAEERRKAAAAVAEDRRKSEEKFDAWMAKSRAEFDRRLAETNRQIGGFTQGIGDGLEQEYIAAVEKKRRIGDIAVQDVYSNPRSADGKYERDLAWGNGKFVVVVEIKSRFTLGDVRKFAKDLLPRFAEKCPTIARGRKIIGGIGGGSIPSNVLQEAANLGLLVLGLRNRELVVKSDKGVRAV